MLRSNQWFFSLKNNETLDYVTQIDKLEGKIFMENPKGYTNSLLTCKMWNPLYGIKQGPKEWNPKINSSTLSKRFEGCNISYRSINISSPIWHQIGIWWRDSHALYQGIIAQKDHHIALILYRGAGCKNFKQRFLLRRNLSPGVKSWSSSLLFILRFFFDDVFSISLID